MKQLLGAWPVLVCVAFGCAAAHATPEDYHFTGVVGNTNAGPAGAATGLTFNGDILFDTSNVDPLNVANGSGTGATTAEFEINFSNNESIEFTGALEAIIPSGNSNSITLAIKSGATLSGGTITGFTPAAGFNPINLVNDENDPTSDILSGFQVGYQYLGGSLDGGLEIANGTGQLNFDGTIYHTSNDNTLTASVPEPSAWLDTAFLAVLALSGPRLVRRKA